MESKEKMVESKEKQKQERDRLAKRKAQNAKHSPWDRWSAADRAMCLKILGGARPVVWTKDAALAGRIREDGKQWALIHTSTEEVAEVTVKKRADGKPDGRSKGLRKCGKCGKPGHNARTCGKQTRRRVKL